MGLEEAIVAAAKFVGAGICMGFGAIGPGIGVASAGAWAGGGVPGPPAHATLLTRTMLIGQAVSESTGIYSLVIALLMLLIL